jgi:sec-independent protein translocase protein TatC
MRVLRERRRRRPSPNEMTIVEHLGELRHRLFVSVAALFAGGMIAWFLLYGWTLTMLKRPYCQVVGQAHCSLTLLGPLDGLSIRFKLVLYIGGFVASPVVLWELWRFITPGLKPNEKRYAVPFVVSSVVLFGAGAVVAYLVFPKALHWLAKVGGPDMHLMYTPANYFNLITILMLAFGLAFEFPVVLVALELAGLVSPAQLLRHWRIAVVAITTAAAILIPSSDPFSFLALAGPMCAFYFGAIGVGKLLGK